VGGLQDDEAGMAGKRPRFGAGVLTGSTVAAAMESHTALRWMFNGFGPLPAEFTKSGATHVFEWTGTQRLVHVPKSTAINAALVFVAYEGGMLIGSILNQALSTDTKDSIGGTINEVINESGWRELWKHPFGWGM
jgi:hypothetical protein